MKPNITAEEERAIFEIGFEEGYQVAKRNYKPHTITIAAESGIFERKMCVIDENS